MTAAELERGRYLGDGVYVSFDGYKFWLAVGHHDRKVVALEPPVLQALNVFAADVQKLLTAEQEKYRADRT